MKLVLFTPCNHESAIAYCSMLLEKELLREGHEVTLVRSEDLILLDSKTLLFETKPLPWNDENSVKTAVEQADFVFYQVGDNFQLHRGCLEWLPRHPGLVCLHDFFIGHLFAEWGRLYRKEALKLFRYWYPNLEAERFLGACGHPSFIDNYAESAPCTEWIASLASGIMVHSRWGVGRVLRACPGPVKVVPLAYVKEKLPFGVNASSKPDEVQQAFQLLTFGNINVNKRAASVIKALGSSSVLKPITHYRLAGAIQPAVKKELQGLASQMGVTLSILGPVDEKTLQQELSNANVVSCLRWPTLEGASASAIEAMLLGKPLLVTNAGFYQDLPDACVCKIDPHNELRDLQAQLEQLATQPEERRKLGERASDWASATFNTKRYVAGMVALGQEVAMTQPSYKALQALSQTLIQWQANESLPLEPVLEPLAIFNARPHSNALPG